MPYSVVIVQRREGGPVKGARVALGYDSWSSGGVTKPAYTDSSGEARVEHSNTGRATVYVDGRDVGTMVTPGEKVVFI